MQQTLQGQINWACRAGTQTHQTPHICFAGKSSLRTTKMAANGQGRLLLTNQRARDTVPLPPPRITFSKLFRAKFVRAFRRRFRAIQFTNAVCTALLFACMIVPRAAIGQGNSVRPDVQTSENSPRQTQTVQRGTESNRPPQSQPRTTAGQSIGMLVLTTGRVVQGRIAPRSDGYMVEQAAGYMFVPAAQVRFEARDLQDAYRKLTESVSAHTPNTHLTIANWCVSHKLYSEAREEVLDALDLQPNRADCRAFLARVDQLIKAPKVRVSRPVTVAKDKWAPPTESLAGLSRKLAQRFNTHVQPILQNKCGSCHGTRDSERDGDFVLLRRSRNHRAVAERNLAVVLRNIDVDVPTSSPLLQATQLGHGGRQRSVFEGRAGQRQIQNVRDWVFQVAAEQSQSRMRTRANAKLASAQFTTSEQNKSAANNSALPGEPRRYRDAFDKQGQHSTTVDSTSDPFDPRVFNRLANGKSKRR